MRSIAQGGGVVQEPHFVSRPNSSSIVYKQRPALWLLEAAQAASSSDSMMK
jgi:hypothetical protein